MTRLGYALTGITLLILAAAVAVLVWPSETHAPTTPQDATSTPQDLHADLIVVNSPKEGELISSPLTVKGSARGTWYFEASFPGFLVDWDGKIIAQGVAQAKSDWMTADFVPFEVTLQFETPTPGDPSVNRGALILKKDNPSGLPEHDDAPEIPIVFK